MSNNNKKTEPDVVINFSDDDIGFGSLDSNGNVDESQNIAKRAINKTNIDTDTTVESKNDVNISAHTVKSDKSNDVDVPEPDNTAEISGLDNTTSFDVPSSSDNTNDNSSDATHIDEDESFASNDNSFSNEDYDIDESHTSQKKRNLLIVIALICIAILLVIIMFLLKNMKEYEKHEENTAAPVTTETTELSLDLLQTEIPYDPTGMPIDATTLVQPEQDGDSIVANPETVDPTRMGTQTINYTVTRNGLTSTIAETFTIADKKAPTIKLKETSVNVKVGDEFDPASNVESVTDDIDGTLEKKKAIDPNTAGYTLSSNVDTSKVGTYQASVNAVDSAGNSANQIYTVYVEEQGKTQKSESQSSNNTVNNNQNQQVSQNKGSNNNSTKTSQNQNNQNQVNKPTPTPASRNEEPAIDEKADQAEGRSIRDLIKQNQKDSEESTKNNN